MSTIHAFRLSQLQLTWLSSTWVPPCRSTPDRAGLLLVIVFHRYPHGRRLCPLQTIRDYVTKRDCPSVERLTSWLVITSLEALLPPPQGPV